MSLICGIQTPTSGGSNHGYSAGNAYRGQDAVDVAVQTAVVATLNLYLFAGTFSGTATLVYLGVFDASGNLLCQGSVSPVGAGGGTGLLTVNIAGGPTLVNGTQYHLLAQANGTGVTPADDGTTFHRNLISNATLPFPASLTFPGSNANAGQQVMWADSGGGGGGPSFPGPLPRTTYIMP